MYFPLFLYLCTMNLPKDFEHFFRECWREDDVQTLVQGLDSAPSVSIRLNTKRMPIDAEPKGADGHVPWCPEGIYLKERPVFTADPLLHAGAYYVQEASSMFLAHVVRQLLPPEGGWERVLDLCAAPGGKSTLLRSLLPDECQLFSNEPIRARAQVLAENLAKWGHPNVQVTQAYAEEIAQQISDFDMIVADVPCSGEGMMRKEPEVIRQWSPSFVADCAALQRSIVADIWPALCPNGYLVYSTCTFNPLEDEENVEWIAKELGAEVISVSVDPTWGISGDLRKAGPSLPVYHFLPGKVRGEGLFLAVLKKRDNHEIGRKRPKRFSLPVLPMNQLDDPEACRVDLSLSDALRYLQREALVLPPETPRGIVQVCYQGQRLGLVKNLGTRANNLYPKEWRIRSGYIVPQTLFTLE